jgi:hypothetical protein
LGNVGEIRGGGQTMTLRFCLFSVVGLCAAGCNFGTASVSGHVTYRGRPLTTGTVYVARSDGVQVPATIGADGLYHFDSLPAGPVKIGVVSLKPDVAGFTPTKQAARGVRVATADPSGWFEIPESYADPLKSGLSLDLNHGPNERNIELP